jgi:SAM-dependent methyltransferase
MTGSINATARRGFAAQADSYARGRPSYGADTVMALEKLIGTGPGWVADVGAGTGALSRLLAERGHAVLAVEPVAAMLEHCPPASTRLRAVGGALPLAPGSVRAITVATAFHWFSTAEALSEFRRCLRPGGVLVLLWNDRDTRVPWVARQTELVDEHAGDAPRFRSMRWRAVVDAHPGFQETAYLERPNPTPTTRAGLVDRVMSTSFVGALGHAEAAAIRGQAEELAATLPEQFDYPYVTRVWAYEAVSPTV